MKYKRVKIIRGEVIVVAFDMCSSTDIIEELTLKSEMFRYQKLLGKIKQYLAAAQNDILFVLYKFTGDGWVLLFPAGNTDGKALLGFLRHLCAFFKREFNQEVMKHLDTPPSVTGINFGVAKGPLFYMKMYGADEYIGRAINVACRLQGAIKDKDNTPAYKVLVTNGVFNDYLSPAKGYKVSGIRRRLRNIRGGAEFRCKKIALLLKSEAA